GHLGPPARQTTGGDGVCAHRVSHVKGDQVVLSENRGLALSADAFTLDARLLSRPCRGVDYLDIPHSEDQCVDHWPEIERRLMGWRVVLLPAVGARPVVQQGFGGGRRKGVPVTVVLLFVNAVM